MITTPTVSGKPGQAPTDLSCDLYPLIGSHSTWTDPRGPVSATVGSVRYKTNMIIYQAFRYELDPTNIQRGRLASHSGAARYAWNWGLEQVKVALERRAAGDLEASVPDAMQLHRAWNAWKKKPGNCDWWSENSKCAYQEAFRDLDRACNTFWRARKVGRRVGFPKFKKKGRADHFRLTQPIRVQPHSVVLPKIGAIRTKEATSKLRGRILSASCRRDADRWFVSLCVRVDRPDPIARSGAVLGIDRGLRTFAVQSDGCTIDSPRAHDVGLRKLRRLSKAVARKRPGSRNRMKARRALARHHRRMGNQRRDALHKVTTKLAKTNSVIVLEDLHIAGLARNHHIARRLHDQGWAELQTQLAYKTTWYGSQLLLAPRFYPSSRICSNCGAVRAKLRLCERVYSCMSCGLRIDRDLNAAVNLARLTELSPQVLRRLETPVETAALATSETAT
jgi:putative transposase